MENENKRIMIQAKKLIEVAMPIKEISAESVRDKSIRHGHISTLHLWWARRPLPVCRAVVFASLVPDPLDDHCPPAFRAAIAMLLGPENNPGDPYKAYADIPWTAVYDPMEDNLRNRLQLFIGKFTDDMQQALLHHKPIPPANRQLSNDSLIKWDNKNNEAIINKARKLIWVAHNARANTPAHEAGQEAQALLDDFDLHYQAIKKAEYALYSLPDRHLDTNEAQRLSGQLHAAIEGFLDKMPRVFDPFAGGGAIPLEAARLGCRSFGNDINPVAHIIQKGSLEFPQKYGKPITYSKGEFVKLYGEEELKRVNPADRVMSDGELTSVKIANRLSFDVEFYAKKLLAEAEKEIGHLYPADEKGNKPVAYYWARVGTCSNPGCRAEVPLLKGFYLANTKTKQVHLKPIIKGTLIDFEINKGKIDQEGFVQSRKTLVCPCCGSITSSNDLKKQFLTTKIKKRLLAIVDDTPYGKGYRLPTSTETKVVEEVNVLEDDLHENLPTANTKQFDVCPWGFVRYGDLFSERQMATLQPLVIKMQKVGHQLVQLEADYGKAIMTYLSILLDRFVTRYTTFNIWDTGYEKVAMLFGRQAIAMSFDYVEVNPFAEVGSNLYSQHEWICRYIESESSQPFSTILKNASSGEKEQFTSKSIDAVITDPPYYDAIAYADLSDFFYVWLKRTLGTLYPMNFGTPQTPKSEECTALKYHHGDDNERSKRHFEIKLLQIFDAIEHQTTDIVSIMFAHQSTAAWTTLCNSILGARMNITGSWSVDTELTSALKADKSFLSSSVTVSCRPSQGQGYGSYKEVKKAVERTVAKEVDKLYRLGFRGADLLTACFGQAVSEFGKYEKVEKADGSLVTVADLLAMAKESAFNALLQGFQGDDFTKFYIGWLQLYGFAESDFNDAVNFTRVGLSINVAELFTEHILIKNLNKQTLGGFEQRLQADKKLGIRADNLLIDMVHRAMALYKGTNRRALLLYIDKVASSAESPFWRVVTSLCEVLPGGSEDHKQALGLLANKDSLLRESKTIQPAPLAEQTSLFE